ncbi:MAG: Tat pathway signal protein [Ignavibacteria bacterium]|nr:Tat pathway signal protein [Ignavibacteria bacterium]
MIQNYNPQKIFLLTLLLIFISSIYSCSKNEEILQEHFQLSLEEKNFLDTLQYKTFLYFLNEVNLENGLIKDRNTSTSPSSIAVVGFSFPIWAIGTEKGWITREKAAELSLKSLEFFWNSEQSNEKLATGYKGFYYHFLNMKTGKRFWNCELSSIDSGLLFCGLIFARQYYSGDSHSEKRIRDLSTKILERAEWSFWQLPESSEYPYQISMGWNEQGIMSTGWFGYTEALFLYVLAAGSGYPNYEKAYESWLNTYTWREPYKKEFGHVVFPPLFGHQYSFLWLNPKGLTDKYMKKKGIDYFENSKRAAYVNREYAIVNPKKWIGYDSLTWGLSACDGPESKYNYADKIFFGYGARGTSGLDSTELDDGTITPTAAGGSIPFAPEICIPTLLNFYKKYGSNGLWGKYGFFDSFNPTLNWINNDYLGLDQGPIIIMIENYLNGFIWKYFMKDPIIISGLDKLGFEYEKN